MYLTKTVVSTIIFPKKFREGYQTESLIIVSGEGSSRRKLRQLADWSAHGFTLISEVYGRDDSVSLIISRSPSLVVIDASIPLSELRDIMEITRSRGFDGHFFLVSSKADFKSAQTALKYGADRYFVMPIDPEELAAELKLLHIRIEQQRMNAEFFAYSRSYAFRELLRNVVLFGIVPEKEILRSFDFEADLYQVAIIEPLVNEGSSSRVAFSDIIKKTGIDKVTYDTFCNGAEVVLIRGSRSIRIIIESIREYAARLKDNANFFLSLGNPVSSLNAINTSYTQAKHVADRKFLVSGGTVVFSYENSMTLKCDNLSANQMSVFCRQFLNGLQTFKRHNVLDVTDALRDYLVSTQASTYDIKLFLADLFLQIKGSFLRLYSTANIPFASNTEILTLIERKVFLHEVLTFYSEQFDLIMSSIGGTSRDSVLDDIFYYISHNYSSPIKLETLASLFGYNSAYLGKIFHKAAGMSFNNYIDKLRVEHSMKLLRESDMKVYEIAKQVGYKSVDYYHKKFRAITGESPAEYRKKIQADPE